MLKASCCCYLIPFALAVTLWLSSEISSTTPSESETEWEAAPEKSSNDLEFEQKINNNNNARSISSCKCGAGMARLNITKIVGGVSSKTHAWPWMAVIITGAGSLCGGSLINNWYILTAAHCVAKLTPPQINSTIIVLGRNRINTNSTSANKHNLYRVAKNGIIVHPKYVIDNVDDDIALIKLATPIKKYSRFINPICLEQTGSPFVGRKALTMGWGKIAENATAPSNVLRETKVIVISNNICNNSYPHLIGPSKICAYRYKHDACNGDSGGPLIVPKSPTTATPASTTSSDDNGNCTGRGLVGETKYYTQIGIVSFGLGCARLGYPGVYTRVHNYIPWIKRLTKGASYCVDSF